MNFSVGRENFALTVFVPYDCTHNCPFCTTKCLYKNTIDTQEVNKQICDILSKAASSPIITDIVFTGGEPMADLDALEKFIKLVPKKNVYINTNLLKEGFFRFVKLVNKSANVKGISVSRHCRTEAEEATDQVEDWCIEAFEKNIRVNCVLDHKMKPAEVSDFMEDVLSRWSGKNVTVNFRADYQHVTHDNLHSLDHPLVKQMISGYDYVSRSGCMVCDTMSFVDPVRHVPLTFHRGLQLSSLDMKTMTIVNDAIFMPDKDGDWKLFYDWDGKESDEFEGFIFDKKTKTTTRKRASSGSASSSTSYSPGYSCGWSSC